MTELLEFLSSNELIIVICLLVAIFGLILAIIIIDIYSRRKNRNTIIDEEVDEDLIIDSTDMEINRSGLGMVADTSALDRIDVEAVTKNLEKTQEIEEIKYVEEDEELEKTKALLELESIKRELAKAENQEYLDEEPEVNIELVEQEEPVEIQEEINEEALAFEEITPAIEDEVEKFETDQEEHAIISVEELAKKSLEITDEEIEQYEDDGNEPISLKELEAMYKSIEEPTTEVEEVIQEEIVPKEETIKMPDFEIKVKPAIDVYDDKHFKNTPVISPVFGINATESSIALEQTANLDKLNEEIKKTNEFLLALKELRKNLD